MVRLLFSFLLLATACATAQEKVLNPVQNASLADCILYQPQEMIEDEKIFSELFLTAPENTLIVAPVSGTISNFGIGYLYSLTFSKGGHLNTDESYQTQKEEAITVLKDINPKCLNVSVSIITDDGTKYYIKGITPKTILKSGERVEQGHVLGNMGFAYHKIPEPCIIFSVSKNKKSIDPLSVFGLKSKFVDDENAYDDYQTKKHSPDELSEAFNIIRESLEEGHPGLYDYAPQSTIDSMFRAVRAEINTPMTSEEFRFLITPLLEKIGDSHLNIYGQSNNPISPFPPALFGLENSVVKIFNTLKGYEKYLNKEVIEINGEPSEEVMQKLSPYILESDGYIRSLKDEILILYMSTLYYKKYKIKAGDKIQYKFADNSTAEFTWKILGDKDLLYPDFIYKNKNYRYKTSFPSKNVALLEIRTFHLLETDKDSIEYFIRTIEKNKCKNLIIDLRDNKGGEGYDLFGMLVQQPFQSLLYTKVNKQHYDFFKYTSNYNFPHAEMFGGGYKKANNGYYYYSNSLSPVNDSIHYSGKLYVLTNANSKSASALFAALVHKYKRGVVIGQETGTAYHQMNAAKFASVMVGNTGLTMRIPLVKLVFDTPGDSDITWGRGVIPDYPVELKFEDYFSEKDRILDFTLDLIKNN
jgi:C-terminal processing protease CtpA/Prc